MLFLALAKVIALSVMAAGLFFLVSPKMIRKFLAFWREGKRIYLAGVLRIMFGMIFLLASPYCKFFEIIVVFGLIVLVVGLLFFILKMERIKALLEWWRARSFLFYRLWALLAIALGGFLLYAI
jgi:hypothetical protein